MTQARKQLAVTIAGQNIRVKSDGDDVYLQTLARYVEKKIQDISRQTRTVTTQRVALLAAMDIADEFFRAREMARGFRREVRERSQRMLDLLETQPAEDNAEL